MDETGNNTGILTPRSSSAPNAGGPFRCGNGSSSSLPNGDKYDYTCVYCGTSVGDKMVTERDNLRIILK